MSPELGYALVLAAAVGHAGWNALLKASGDRLLSLAAIRLTGLVLGVIALPFVPWPAPESWGPLAGAAAAHFVYYALLLGAYGVGDLGVVHPISRGIVPLLLAASAWLALGERLSGAQALAIATISVGIGVLALRAGASRVAVLLALATGASVTAYSLLGALGARTAGTVLGFQAWLEITTGLGVLGVVTVRRPWSAIKAYTRTSATAGLAAGVVSVAGYGAYLLATTVLPVATAAALRESSALFSALIGALIHKESFGTRRLVAAGLVTGGIVALALMR